MCFDSVPSLHGGHCGRGVRVGVERQHLGADEVLDEGERSTCAVDSPIELHTAGHTSSSQCTIYLISTKIIIAASLRSAVENGKVEAERRLAAIIIFVDSSGYRSRACIGS